MSMGVSCRLEKDKDGILTSGGGSGFDGIRCLDSELDCKADVGMMGNCGLPVHRHPQDYKT